MGLFGGADTDLLSFFYRGENDGQVMVTLDGQDGNDWGRYEYVPLEDSNVDGEVPGNMLFEFPLPR